MLETIKKGMFSFLIWLLFIFFSAFGCFGAENGYIKVLMIFFEVFLVKNKLEREFFGV
jgi:hypothetical protein